ncbi:hypothetical protein MTP99_002805 [Tenebrio molitor]|nr:hypothetical protein MTP99_002805 [Tenebrio molitor]
MRPYPRTPTGNRFILVVTDLFSRWVEGFAIPTSTTFEIVRFLEEEVFTRQGYPGASSPTTAPNSRPSIGRGPVDIGKHERGRRPHIRPGKTERRNQELKKALRFRLAGRRKDT